MLIVFRRWLRLALILVAPCLIAFPRIAHAEGFQVGPWLPKYQEDKIVDNFAQCDFQLREPSTGAGFLDMFIDMELVASDGQATNLIYCRVTKKRAYRMILTTPTRFQASCRVAGYTKFLGPTQGFTRRNLEMTINLEVYDQRGWSGNTGPVPGAFVDGMRCFQRYFDFSPLEEDAPYSEVEEFCLREGEYIVWTRFMALANVVRGGAPIASAEIRIGEESGVKHGHNASYIALHAVGDC